MENSGIEREGEKSLFQKKDTSKFKTQFQNFFMIMRKFSPINEN